MRNRTAGEIMQSAGQPGIGDRGGQIEDGRCGCGSAWSVRGSFASFEEETYSLRSSSTGASGSRWEGARHDSERRIRHYRRVTMLEFVSLQKCKAQADIQGSRCMGASVRILRNGYGT